ncbi:MAG: hypothetical protein ACYSW0_18420 [Planctomycetota bacterium]|jgi:hypothetical protein
MDKEFVVLCDDGEEYTITAANEVEAMTIAHERGLKPVGAEEVGHCVEAG